MKLKTQLVRTKRERIRDIIQDQLISDKKSLTKAAEIVGVQPRILKKLTAGEISLSDLDEDTLDSLIALTPLIKILQYDDTFRYRSQ